MQPERAPKTLLSVLALCVSSAACEPEGGSSPTEATAGSYPTAQPSTCVTGGRRPQRRGGVATDAGGSSATGPQPSLRVLFVGNSFTFYHDVPGQLRALAEQAGEPRRLEVEAVANPSQTLKSHYELGDVGPALDGSHWDMVVLQELSPLEVDKQSEFFEYGSDSAAQIRAHGAEVMLYVTWVEEHHTPIDQLRATSSYVALAHRLHAALAPVGAAFLNARAADPRIGLHDPDYYHANEKGSYLAACVFYSVLYGRSPEGLASPNDAVGGDAAFLQSVAWLTVSAGSWSAKE